MIVENYDPDSRPQTGLAAASLIIETLAEDGITRFMAIYLEKDAPIVGPVRSTRVYFNRWAAGFHTILTHVGGNDDAQNMLWTLPRVFNIDEQRWEISLYNTGTPLFWRSADRVAPHNMYASTFKLRAYAAHSGQNWAYAQAYILHKHSAPLASRGHSGLVHIGFVEPYFQQENAGYDVAYQYDRISNTYLRIMAGVPHVDAATGRPLRPSNIIVMKTGPAAPDPYAGATPYSISIPTIGSGQSIYFQDGKVRFGGWQQKNEAAPLRFFDARGHEMAFNPGQTWVEVLPAGSPVTWSFR